MTTEPETIDAEDVAEVLPVRREEAGAVNLFGDASPADVIAKAHAAAVPLARVINEQRLYKEINGKKHVYVEGWTLLGSMLGVFPVVEWTRPLEGGGWEARVVAQTINGAIVGSAEAQCTREEDLWSFSPPKGKARDDYALRSMAQTRATSKALRLPLGFVMTLAGYEATPSEEMPDTAGGSTPKPHDPATDLPAGFPAGRDLADRIGKALAAVDPSVDWKATWDNAIDLTYDKKRADLKGDEQREAWTRLANVADKLAPLTGTFPPPTDEDIQQAFAYAFDGHIVNVVRHEPVEPVEPAPLGDHKPDVDENVPFNVDSEVMGDPGAE